MTDVKVVAPANMGERLDWDAQNKKYNVNVSDLIKRIEALEAKTNFDPSEFYTRDDGKVALSANKSLEFTDQWDLQKGVPQRGFSVFHGNGFIKGVPRDIYSTAYKQQAALTLQEYMDGVNRPVQDWTGWQIANGSEITQFIMEESLAGSHPVNVWCRQNANGIDINNPENGAIDVNAWSDWVRLTNIA